MLLEGLWEWHLAHSTVCRLFPVIFLWNKCWRNQGKPWLTLKQLLNEVVVVVVVCVHAVWLIDDSLLAVLACQTADKLHNRLQYKMSCGICRYTIYSPKDGQPCMDHDRSTGEVRDINLFLYSIYSVLWRCWLGGRKGTQLVKNWAVGCWHGYLSAARCRLACGPADATATHCLLLQWNPDWFYLSGTGSPG